MDIFKGTIFDEDFKKLLSKVSKKYNPKYLKLLKNKLDEIDNIKKYIPEEDFDDFFSTEKDSINSIIKMEMLYPFIKDFDLGEKRLNSGKVIASDPAYSIDTLYNGTIENIKTGIWNAKVTIIPSGFTGGARRNSKLEVRYKDTKSSGPLELTDIDVVVDSGQAGIFDLTFFNTFSNDDELANKLCDDVIDSPIKAKNIVRGVISSSGFGDGSYKCFVRKNKNKEVVCIQIVFIDEKKYE